MPRLDLRVLAPTERHHQVHLTLNRLAPWEVLELVLVAAIGVAAAMLRPAAANAVTLRASGLALAGGLATANLRLGPRLAACHPA